MGVDRQDYIIYGWKLPYELIDNDGNEIDLHSNEIYQYITGNNEYIMIQDGMCGEYNVFGKLIACQNNDWDGWDFMKLNIENYNANEAKAKLKEVFNLALEEEPYLFIFSHFS